MKKKLWLYFPVPDFFPYALHYYISGFGSGSPRLPDASAGSTRAYADKLASLCRQAHVLMAISSRSYCDKLASLWR